MQGIFFQDTRVLQVHEFYRISTTFWFVTIPSPGEGTGTRPDYLVNRVLTKNEGPHPKKNVRKSRNRCKVNSGGVGAHGQLTRCSNGLSPETNTNAQRILFMSCLLRSPWYPLVPNYWSSRTVSNRESRYPPPGGVWGGYRDSARFLVNCDDKKLIWRKSGKSWRVNSRGCGCIGTVDSGHKCAQSWDQIPRLKNYISCHIYCVYRSTHLYRTDTASRAVSNGKSRYPRCGSGFGLVPGYTTLSVRVRANISLKRTPHTTLDGNHHNRHLWIVSS